MRRSFSLLLLIFRAHSFFFHTRQHVLEQLPAVFDEPAAFGIDYVDSKESMVRNAINALSFCDQLVQRLKLAVPMMPATVHRFFSLLARIARTR